MGNGAKAYPWPEHLELRSGETVVVREPDEILLTLDEKGTLQGMPFMPEMFTYCGKRIKVASRAVRLCDTVLSGEGRRLNNAVHLEGVRCDGSAHGGCQAKCLIWWREAWLKREGDDEDGQLEAGRTKVSREDLDRLTQRRGFISATLYSCQLTKLRDFSFGQRWYDPRILWRSLKARNVDALESAETLWWALKANLREKLGLKPHPNVRGRLTGRTPSGRIPDLKPGDWVQVKSQEAIEATLNRGQRNRGLFFDVEMLPYCGRKMRLLAKVDQIIDEKTGAMRELPNDCWILEGGVCGGLRSRRRLFCTRRIYSYWREIWFEGKVDPPLDPSEEPRGVTLPTVG